MMRLESARAYLAKMPPAISGQGGHKATFAVACRLVEFGYSFESCFALLSEWNATRCEPKWTEAELIHKLRDAYKRTKPNPQFGKSIPWPVLTCSSAAPDAADRRADSGAAGLAIARHLVDAVKAQPINRPAPWKLTLRAGEPVEHEALARVRGLSVEAVRLAAERGLLRFGQWYGFPAWFIVDKSNRAAQARRLDGLPWTLKNNRTAPCQAKTLNLTCCQASWPVGVQEAEAFPSVALVEGGPDLVAVFHFLIQQGRAVDCAPVAMLGAYVSIDPVALPLFAGKRVRIFAHADDAGSKAAKTWAAQLAPVAASVDAFSLCGLSLPNGAKVKDLNDLARLAPEARAAVPCLNSLFP